MSSGYKSNLKQVEEAIADMTRDILDAAGPVIVKKARDIVPVLTGQLRDSISYVIEGDTLSVGATADHSLYIEKGTSQQPAQPYLEPAIYQSQTQIQQIAQQRGKRL